jgi:hypothetical protein
MIAMLVLLLLLLLFNSTANGVLPGGSDTAVTINFGSAAY